ncbi:hypothetical protein KA977_02290 [Candidatus Dependentiae bacterium]|nr:hypothetical protein [Candidatus Dependentiae bacterium]
MELISYIYIDKMQPQFAALTAAQADGDIPASGMASMWIEIQPGIEINRVLDIAVKTTSVRPAVLLEEREYGIVEFHSFSQDEVLTSGRKILETYKLTDKEVRKPVILTSQIITNISDYHAQIINRKAEGSLLIPGQSLYILEIQPACWSTIAANEAEKAVDIDLVHYRYRGRYGRLHLSGSESQVTAAKDAVETILSSYSAKKNL